MRATVPEGIVAFLDIKEGDKLIWKMEIRNNERISIVARKNNDLSEATKTALKYAKPKGKG